jgi:hypothetical protein
MFAAIIEVHLGKYGMMLLDFYMAHRVIINFIVVGYGLILILAHRNFKQVAKILKQKMKKEDLDIDEMLNLLKKDQGFWDALKKELKIPIITARSSFLLYSLTKANVIKIMRKKTGLIK